MKRKLKKGLFGIVVMLLLVGGFCLGIDAGPKWMCMIDLDCPPGLICVYGDGMGICIVLREDCQLDGNGCGEIIVTPEGSWEEILKYTKKRPGYL